MTTARARRPLAVIAVVSAAFLAGIAVRGLVGPSSSPSAAHDGRSTPAATAPEPDAKRVGLHDGMPAGFARSKDGARAAAVAYVLTGQVLIDLSPARMDAAVRAMSSTATADMQVATAQQQLDQLRQVLAPGTGPTSYLQAVLATRVDTFAPSRAEVSVWNVGVLSRVGVAAPQAGWDTSAFELVWERSDWRVRSETISAGPAPALNAGVAPATAETLAADLNGFTPWETP
ncbi:MAG: hypothetical protein ACLPVY_20360 [Acidimicrobiia bacterium]